MCCPCICNPPRISQLLRNARMTMMEDSSIVASIPGLTAASPKNGAEHWGGCSQAGDEYQEQGQQGIRMQVMIKSSRMITNVRIEVVEEGGLWLPVTVQPASFWSFQGLHDPWVEEDRHARAAVVLPLHRVSMQRKECPRGARGCVEEEHQQLERNEAADAVSVQYLIAFLFQRDCTSRSFVLRKRERHGCSSKAETERLMGLRMKRLRLLISGLIVPDHSRSIHRRQEKSDAVLCDEAFCHKLSFFLMLKEFVYWFPASELSQWTSYHQTTHCTSWLCDSLQAGWFFPALRHFLFVKLHCSILFLRFVTVFRAFVWFSFSVIPFHCWCLSFPVWWHKVKCSWCVASFVLPSFFHTLWHLSELLWLCLFCRCPYQSFYDFSWNLFVSFTFRSVILTGSQTFLSCLVSTCSLLEFRDYNETNFRLCFQPQFSSERTILCLEKNAPQHPSRVVWWVRTCSLVTSEKQWPPIVAGPSHSVARREGRSGVPTDVQPIIRREHYSNVWRKPK